MGLRTKIRKLLYLSKFSTKHTSLKINKKNILITGANSGIGLSLTKKLLELDNNVLATYRESQSNLKNKDNKNFFLDKFDQKKI